jgi:hypothetical protein
MVGACDGANRRTTNPQLIRMYFLSFEAHPKPANPVYGHVDGAFAAAFVNESVAGAAEAIARAFIEEVGWDVGELDVAHPVELATFPPEHPSRRLFEQALVDGIVVTFHQWPVGAPEDEKDDS